MKKRIYDIKYREKNREILKQKKKIYFQITYDPAAESVKRKRRMPKHVEYCRNPEYRKWKSDYDKKYLAKKKFGEFWEAAILVNGISDECLSRMNRYEMDLLNGKLNKATNRRRQNERTHCRKFEGRALGCSKSDQRRRNAAISG